MSSRITYTKKSALFGLIALSLSACTNNVTQHTYSQAVATAEQTVPVAKTAMIVPAQVSVPMTPNLIRPSSASGTLANGAYFYRRYQ